MRKCLLAFLLFLPGIVLALDFSYEYSNTSLMDYSVCGRLSAQGEVSSVNVTLKAYPNTNLVAGSGMNVTFSEGQKVLSYFVDELGGVLDYCYDAQLTNGIRVDRIPSVLHFPYDSPGFDEFLVFGNQTDYSSELRETSLNITDGSASTLEAAARIGVWVSSNMDYDLAYSNVTKNSAWIIENRVGVCEEYTNLFISLCRSAGIPARYVSGFVYSNGSFGPHAWAEAWVGEWAGFDTTYAEFGALDSSHIPFFYSLEHESIVEVNYLSRNADISSSKPVFTIGFANVLSDAVHLDSTFVLSKEEVNEDDYFYGTLSVMNDEPHYLLVSFDVVRSCMSEGAGCKPGTEIIVVEDNPSFIIVPPESTASKSIVFRTPHYNLTDFQYVSGSVGVKGVLIGSKTAGLKIMNSAERTSLDEALLDASKTEHLSSVRITSFDLPNLSYGGVVEASYSVKNLGDEPIDMILNFVSSSIESESTELNNVLSGEERSGKVFLNVLNESYGLKTVRFIVTSGNRKVESARTINVALKPDLNFFLPESVDLREERGLEFSAVNLNRVNVNSVTVTLLWGEEPVIHYFNPGEGNFSSVLDLGFVSEGDSSLSANIVFEDSFGTNFYENIIVRVHKPRFHWFYVFKLWISNLFK
ncbi:MAG: transglutaminase domain-containing protein [Nanoarchaeota archaeon]|nr:transglutaminase domain-containing protein [Nanoarchaeota archaeon]